MKKIIVLFLFCTLMSSCTVQRYQETYSKIDFRPYTEQGFIISPLQSYPNEYQPIVWK